MALFDNQIEPLRAVLKADKVTDDDTVEAMKTLWAKQYMADPHSAVAYKVLREKVRQDQQGAFLATAHPSKFRDDVERVLGVAVPLPAPLAEVEHRPLLSEELAVDVDALKSRLLA